MTDNWNLKENMQVRGEYFYYDDDIKKLYHKLREDLSKWINHPNPPTDEQMKQIEEILNKRFGDIE